MTVSFDPSEDGECFIDPAFPRDSSCLIDHRDDADENTNWEKNPESVEWLRAKDIPCLNDGGEPCQVFQGSIEPNDIV